MRKKLIAETDEFITYALSDFVHKTGHCVACELRNSRLSSHKTGYVYLLDENKNGVAAKFLWRGYDGLDYRPINQQSEALSMTSYMCGDVVSVQAAVWGGCVEYYIEVKPTY